MSGRFVGRKKELDALQKKWEAPGFQMVVLYGRRRTGKTTLLNKFMDGCSGRVISFACVDRTEAELIRMMGDAVLRGTHPELLGTVSFDSFDKIFEFAAAAAKEQRLIFLIDEYPYLAKQCPYMNSLIQKFADHDWKDTQLYFILCGSLVSFMRDEVLGKDAPLHGRSTLELKLRPFDYLESAEFVPDFSVEEKAIVYGLTGGIAKYLEQFDSRKSLDENIREQFFDSTGYFTEEQIKTVVTGERQNPTAYISIISAIASGHTKYSEIASASGIGDISYYLKVLTESEIIEKRLTPKTYYILSDSMLAFWFRYVSDAASLINAGRGAEYYDKVVKGQLHHFMGPVYEEMARQYICRYSGTERLPVFVTDVSEYQNTVKGEDRKLHQVEIDLVGYSGKKAVLAGECKFRSKPFDKGDLDSFLDKIRYLPAASPYLAVFSLGGFDRDVKERKDILLVDGEEMYC